MDAEVYDWIMNPDKRPVKIEIDGKQYPVRIEVAALLKVISEERDELREIAERLEVLAVKWVHAGHHDWPEIKELSKRLKTNDPMSYRRE